MKVSIESGPAFSALGIEGHGPAAGAVAWIGPLWNRARQGFGQIQHLVKADATGFWGLMSGTEQYLAPWGTEGRYLAGWEVESGTEPPEGWTVWHAPAQTYGRAAK